MKEGVIYYHLYKELAISLPNFLPKYVCVLPVFIGNNSKRFDTSRSKSLNLPSPIRIPSFISGLISKFNLIDSVEFNWVLHRFDRRMESETR